VVQPTGLCHLTSFSVQTGNKLEISAGFVIVNIVQLQVQQAVLLEKALPLIKRNSTYGLWNCTNKLNAGKCMEVSSGKE